MNTLNIIVICFIAAAALILISLRPPSLSSQIDTETFTDDAALNTKGPGTALMSSASSLAAAAKQCSILTSFVPDVGTTYNADKSIAVFPAPSQTWLLEYQTHLRKTIVETLNSLLVPPNALMIFTLPNFTGRSIIIPFGFLANVGSTATFTNTNTGHVLLFSEILKLPKPAGGNTFSCVVPKNYKAKIGFNNNAPPLELPEGAHATLTAPDFIISLQITKTA